MADPKPTIGRIVHFWAMRAKPVTGEMYLHPEAAIITDVDEKFESVDLTVFPPSCPYNQYQQKNGSAVTLAQIAYSDVPRAGFWSWPARV